MISGKLKVLLGGGVVRKPEDRRYMLHEVI